MMERDDRPLIEVSWEVANKVGGIYTVVSSKAKLLTEHYEHYLCIGPLFPGRHPEQITERPAPDDIAQTIDILRSQGIHCMYGTWNIPGEPQVVLIDASSSHINFDEIKGQYWDEFSVDTLHAQWDVEEPLRWASAAGMFIDTYQRVQQKPVIAQFHEWMGGFGALYCKLHNPQVATVFTTHATVLGRSMSANTNQDIYAQFGSIDASEKARELGVFEKHSAERACAQNADIFTTVSHITSMESEHILGRKPDVVLPNGLVSEHFPSEEKETHEHRRSRESLRDFIYAYFFGHHQFDLDNTLIFFTNGRYEYHNKGLDVLTDALGRLNSEMREQQHPRRVVVFYFIPGDAHGIKEEVLQSHTAFRQLRSYIDEHIEDLTRQILRHALDIDKIASDELLSEESRERIGELAEALVRRDHPPLCTHYLPFEDTDDIISSFRKNGLDNGPEDFVKVIRFPIYLDGHDGLLDLTMEQAAAGCHLGLFPSYYEPWGYTPLESAANGTPAITTDLAGFGRFVRQEEPDQHGVLVLDRHGRSYEDIVDQLFSSMRSFVDLSHEQRAQRRTEAKRVSTHTEWQTFIKHYLQAHNDAYEIAANR